MHDMLKMKYPCRLNPSLHTTSVSNNKSISNLRSGYYTIAYSKPKSIDHLHQATKPTKLHPKRNIYEVTTSLLCTEHTEYVARLMPENAERCAMRLIANKCQSMWVS
jgi:hypothetical protein